MGLLKKRKLLAAVLCLAMVLSLAIPALADTPNPNKYAVTVEQTGEKTYGVYMTHTAGSDNACFLSLDLTCVAVPETVTCAAAGGSGIAAEKTAGGFRLYRDTLGAGFALGSNVKTLVATLTLSAAATVSYTGTASDGITNAGYRDGAAFTVTVNPMNGTPAPEFTNNAVSLTGAQTVGKLTFAGKPDSETTYKLYSDPEHTKEAGTAAVGADGKLALTFNTAPTEAALYYVTATNFTKVESAATPISALVYTNNKDVDTDTLSAIVPPLASGGAGTNLEAQYNAEGRMIMIRDRNDIQPGTAFTVYLLDAAASAKIITLDSHYGPACAALVWVKEA